MQALFARLPSRHLYRNSLERLRITLSVVFNTVDVSRTSGDTWFCVSVSLPKIRLEFSEQDSSYPQLRPVLVEGESLHRR